MQVTSGRVVYSRTIQPASFESERAEVELSFVVSDGENPVAAAEAAMAVARERALATVGRGQSDKQAERRRRFRSRDGDGDE